VLEIYMALTVVFFGITVIAFGREVEGRPDFKPGLFGGTLNVYRYYKHLKRNNEKFSTRFRLFLMAQLNLGLFMIIFLITTLLRFA